MCILNTRGRAVLTQGGEVAGRDRLGGFTETWESPWQAGSGYLLKVAAGGVCLWLRCGDAKKKKSQR